MGNRVVGEMVQEVICQDGFDRIANLNNEGTCLLGIEVAQLRKVSISSSGSIGHGAVFRVSPPGRRLGSRLWSHELPSVLARSRRSFLVFGTPVLSVRHAGPIISHSADIG